MVATGSVLISVGAWSWMLPNGSPDFPRLGVLGIFYHHGHVRGALGEVLLQGDLAKVLVPWPRRFRM